MFRKNPNRILKARQTAALHRLTLVTGAVGLSERHRFCWLCNSHMEPCLICAYDSTSLEIEAAVKMAIDYFGLQPAEHATIN